MADKINPQENNAYNLLPKFYRSDANKKFLQATVDQLVQPGKVKKVNGYIGRQNSKATTGTDIFVEAPSDARQDYQLEPGLTIKDSLDNVTFFKDYQDYINQLGVFGSNVKNHARLNKQEFYSWNPHIDWDKFVNFQNYYWMPYGPDLIKVAGQQQKIESTYTVSLESELDSYEYVFTPNGLSRNPTISLVRGQTYTFEINSPGHPFSFKTRRTSGSLDRYQTVDFNQSAVEQGTITITIPYDAPDVMYYVSEANIDVGGVVTILSVEENSAIDVEAEIVGKKTYKLADGTLLSNGMLLSFIGKVTPEQYATNEWYVEGVGNAITLVKKSELELISSYTVSESVLFDSTDFDSLPFSDATSLASAVDYHVINRASLDKNAWTRYNRWFHKDVINTSAELNGKIASLDQTRRAVRPIIEFEAGLKLFNFGTKAIADVDLIDTYTTDVFSTVEGTAGYNVDGVPLANGQRILFTADTDSLVKGKVFRVEFIDVLHYNEGSRQIHLVLEDEPALNDTVLVRYGTSNSGMAYWYDGSNWQIAQQKSKTNQPPLFDIIDDNKVSFGDTTVYEGSTFKGTSIFSYKQGAGTTDSNLGFALSYKNINNIGDIVFNFNILSDTFQYKSVSAVIEQNTSVGYLYKVSPLTELITYSNGWETSKATNNQAGVRVYKNSGLTNNFKIDIFDDVNDLDDLVVRVYINGIRLDKSLWSVTTNPDFKMLVLETDIELTDVLTVRTFATQPINSNGYYEIPVNLQNNPLNGAVKDFTLGEVIDHVNSIVDNLDNFEGSYPGASNLRDLGLISAYGTRFVQHSSPASLSVYHITSQASNVIRAIETARDEYGKFKRNFINIIDTIGVFSPDPVEHVNLILQTINKDKPKTSPYYFSDMVAYSACIKNSYTVLDYRIKTYPLINSFSIDTLSNNAVYVYLNGEHLLYGRDYTFDPQGFVVIAATLATDDTVTIYEYDSTDGCFVPETPTKLGLWPKYEPKKYVDTTLVTPREMIQGHDGSQVLAYGDYRDDLILELEKRIFNNIKTQYDANIFDVLDLIPSYIRETPYSKEEYNEVLAPQFYKWTSLIDKDFSKPLSFDRTNPKTYNYKNHAAPDGRATPGYWRGIYRWMFDTDRPNLCPWEMLGFTVEPTWWQTVYGPAPYTNNNLVMWEDISNGLVKEPGVPVVTISNRVRPFLMDHLPVDENGNIISPLETGLATGLINQSTQADFVFGDGSPIEGTWLRSSYYPYSVLITALLLQPAKTFGTVLDRSRVVRNLTNQLVYKDTGLRITPASVILPSIYSSDTRVQTSGIVNYIVDYILSDNLKSYTRYAQDLQDITAQLSYRLGAFTSKEKFNLLLDSKTPASSGSVFVPQEDYEIVLNSSSPVKKITYSGIIITKLSDGFEVKGYSRLQPFFKYYPWVQSGATINVGGISESFTQWTPNEHYSVGKIVKYTTKYYRVKTTHTSSAEFDLTYFQGLPSLPVVGGKNANTRVLWDRTTEIVVPYGTKFRTIQDTFDFIVGYGEWLKDQGFIFDDFNNQLGAITNWETSAKEFLFWTTQNWSSGADKWEEWIPLVAVPFQKIVRYNGDFYQAVRNVPESDVFDLEDFVKLDGLSTVGSSVISLSPSASKLTFSAPLCVVDDIRNTFNGYDVYKVDGTALSESFIDNYREDNIVSYSPKGQEGLFGATFYLVQKEQVVLLKNTTMFGDIIYNLESGYRQERIKVSGYVSTNWNGSFNAPGFIFDQAKVNDWTPWSDYALGDIVKYKEFYYSAAKSLPGTELFAATDWIKLDEKPTTKLLPNWSYKAEQFTDFYSLDSDNFDVGQQKMAQHLVGYQKRQYLENIIQDDVSEFKFYQGMIIEKGSQNVFNKLFDVLSADGEESLNFYEEWAVRVGQYGASSAFDNVEFVLDESLFKNNPQGIELVTKVDASLLDFIIRQTPNDVYLKPVGYNNEPWPVVSNFTSYLRTPGPVRPDEVTSVIKTIDDVVAEDVSKFSEGSYVWVGFEGREWNVYRFTELTFDIVSVAYTNNILTVETSNLYGMSPGDYIAIVQPTWQGFYQVATTEGDTFTINTKLAGFTANPTITVHALVTQRATDIDSSDIEVPVTKLENELLWTGRGVDGKGKWATWKYNSVYSKTDIVSTKPADALGFGRNVSVDADGKIALVSDELGQVTVYAKPVQGVAWAKIQTILPSFISGNEENANTDPDSVFGTVTAVSPDGNWLAIGSPTASLARTNYLGTYSNSNSYVAGNVVKDGSELYQALKATSARPSTTPADWKLVTLIEVDVNGSQDEYAFAEQGVVTIYVKNSLGLYSFVTTFASPNASENEHFGSSLAFGDNTLFVTADDDTGRVYQLNYTTIVPTTALYNPVGSAGQVVKVSSTVGILPGMYVTGTGFTLNQQVISVEDSTTILVSASPNSEPFGKLSFSITQWKYSDFTGMNESVSSGSKYGNSVVISRDASTLAISAPGTSQEGNVFVYKLVDGEYSLVSTITGDSIFFGQGIALSGTGYYLAVSSILADVEFTDQGAVLIYEYTDGEYVQNAALTINDRTPEEDGHFGSKLFFMNDDRTIVVFSDKGVGHIEIYDKYNTKWIFGETLIVDAAEGSGYGTSISVGTNNILVGAPTAEVDSVSTGIVYQYGKKRETYSWTMIHQEIDKIDISRIKSAFLYNRRTNKLISYIDVVDPVQGKIPGPAEQELKYKTFFDPAVYSVGDSAVTVDDGIAWKKSQVGMLWWDLRTAKFLDSSVNDTVYRNSTWNTLFPGASIDIYEWVESKLLPADWNLQADTDAGIALGISGIALSETAYSIEKRYDNVSKSFKNTYYYWVKNKKTIPNIAERHMSANDVSTLIGNTRGKGYSYLALTSTNSFSLVNVKEKLEALDVVLSVQYWNSTHKNQNIHSQWKLISDNPDTSLPLTIEQKWFDSLCGKDEAGRVVPDPDLPPKLSYGVENRPRQSMFVNRFEALKEFIERVNSVLISEQIAGQRDLGKLQTYEAEPLLTTGLYDVVFDTDVELRYANVGSFTNAILTPVVEDGKVVSVNIVEPGRGYVVAPYVTVTGNGTNAIVRTVINSKGQVTNVTIVNAGEGYTDSTSLSVRSYTALVHSDTQAVGQWSLYSYDPSSKVWSRVRSKSYDTRDYWAYVDWYASGYNQFTAVDFSVDTFSDLNSIITKIGQTVKVRTTSSGTWFILEKYADSTSIDWTQSYKVVGQQNGTIQFKPTLYQFTNTVYGYDGSLFDGNTFDNSATIELRYILSCLKNNILIDTLKQTYLDLFFASVRYAMSEQTYLDWVFKTSFVKARHNVGPLHQPSNYKNDNLTDFESYVSEVKPYRTKIREYVSTYSKIDPSHTMVTDFDLQPAYEEGKMTVVNATVVDEKILSNDIVIDTYPWKNWLDNASYSVTSLELVDTGALYHNAPVVRFISKSGSGAQAKAYITNGKVTRVILTNPGSGYLAAPTVILEGGMKEGGTQARAVAIIGNGVTRSQLIKMKFDRVTKTYFITKLEETETFTGTGSRLQFPLKWAPDIRVGKASVTVDGVDVLRDNYKLTKVKSVSRGYTSYSGSIIFTSAPAKGTTVSVSYIKDWELLNAADRVQYYYNPETGQIGKDLAQLMSGVDYGGVVIDGLGFESSQGWDSVPFFSERWDSADPTFDDYITTVSPDTFDFTLPYVPAAGTNLNVYHIGSNSESFLSDGIEKELHYNTIDIAPKVSVTKVVATQGTNTAGSVMLEVADTTGLEVGDVVTDSLISGTATATTSTGNRITLSSTAGLTVDNRIKFSGTLIGGLESRPYYIASINGNQVTVSLTKGGANVVVTTDTGSMKFKELSIFGLDTNIVEIVDATHVKLNQILFADLAAGDELTFTRQLKKDFDFTVNGVGIIILTSAAPAGSYVNVYSVLNPVRLDDPTGSPTATNPNVIMETIVSTGVSSDPTGSSYDVSIPNTFVMSQGDTIIIRKDTSDGAIKPLESDYDTALSGGDLTYNSATGLRAEDIIVDGDGFVTPTTSPATEEVVPGHVFDAVSIKVFDKPYSASANIKVDNYKANGIQTNFEIGQQPNSAQAIIVKVATGSTSVLQTAGEDYVVDYQNNEVSFTVAPPNKSVVSIFSFGFNGANILDIDYFVGDGETLEFITHAKWISKLTGLVYLNGEPSSFEFFKTDYTYEDANRIGIRFGEPPAAGELITYVVVAGDEQTFAVTKTERIATDGSLTYELKNPIGDSLPIESNMLVRVDQHILRGPNNMYFTIKSNKLNYALDKNRFPPHSIDASQMIVYAAGNLLTMGSDYIIDFSGITIKITREIRDLYKNQTLTINVNQSSEYIYTPAQGTQAPMITFVEAYDENNLVEVISSYKHDILDTQRSTYTVSSSLVVTPDTTDFYNYVGLSGGYVNLDRAVLDEGLVWVTRNGELLVPNVDYVLNDDRQSITLTDDLDTADQVTVITYSNNVLQYGIAYMQFKDMLNRNHFKRLSLNKQTRLTRALKFNDLTIEVENASGFDTPNPSANKPGVVEIRGERIEYFKINGNTLSQLRRGTLGTGTPAIHAVGALVQDIGPAETIPYADTTTIERVVSDGSSVVPLKFVPTSVDEIEVFVGGYIIDNEWSNGVEYSVGDIITLGSYTYRCITAHTSTLAVVDGVSKTFYDDIGNWKFFVGNIRLKKHAYKVFNVNNGPDSPEADDVFEAEFSVDGETNAITLTTPLSYGTQVTVVKRNGRVWDSQTNILNDDNKIAGFLKATPGIWYTNNTKYETKLNYVSTFDSRLGSFDNITTTFDKE